MLNCSKHSYMYTAELKVIRTGAADRVHDAGSYLKLTSRSCTSALTFLDVSGDGELWEASLMSVARKFLHFFTFSCISCHKTIKWWFKKGQSVSDHVFVLHFLNQCFTKILQNEMNWTDKCTCPLKVTLASVCSLCLYCICMHLNVYIHTEDVRRVSLLYVWICTSLGWHVLVWLYDYKRHVRDSLSVSSCVRQWGCGFQAELMTQPACWQLWQCPHPSGWRVRGGGRVRRVGQLREQTWDTTGAPGVVAVPVCGGCSGWEAAWAGAWGVITTGVCCGAVTAMATGPFWKSKEETER